MDNGRTPAGSDTASDPASSTDGFQLRAERLLHISRSPTTDRRSQGKTPRRVDDDDALDSSDELPDPDKAAASLADDFPPWAKARTKTMLQDNQMLYSRMRKELDALVANVADDLQQILRSHAELAVRVQKLEKENWPLDHLSVIKI